MTLALSLGVLLMTILSGLNFGVKNYFLQQSNQDKILRELTVTPLGNKLELSLATLIPKSQLTPQLIEKIKQIPEIEEVLPTNSINGISSLQVNLLGQIFQTDALLYGAPYQSLNLPEIPQEEWSQYQNEPYPAVISTKLLDLYNLTFANANNFPQITKENFIGKEITILLNQSTFFETQEGPTIKLKAKILGFSPNVKLIGLTLPDKTIEKINQDFLNKTQDNYLDAIIHVKKPEYLSLVSEKLQNMGFQVKTAEQSLKTVEGIFKVTDLSLDFFFLIMMILSGLLISSTFLNKLNEQGREIAILKTLGMTNQQIGNLYLFEAGLIGSIASLIGIILGIIFSIPLNMFLANFLNHLLSKPKEFFIYSPTLIISLIFYSIFTACIFAYIPAMKAAKLNPIKLLAK